MGLRSVIRGWFNEAETKPIDPRRGQAFWLSMPWIPDGLQLTQHQVFEVSAVWACCNLIANSIAAAPWYVFDVDRQGRRKKLTSDPLAWMLNTQPNPEEGAQSAKESLIWQALIYGDSFAEITFDGANRPAQWWPLLSERMLLPARNPDGSLRWEYRNLDGGLVVIPSERLFHLRGPSIDGLMGLGTVTAAMKAIATAAAQDRFASSYFANAATPSGIVTTPKPLQPKDREALKTEIKNRYSGSRNHGTPWVLEGGADFKPVSNNPEEAALVAGSQFSLEQIARYFGVPLHFLASPQGAQGYGRNLSELGHALINYGLRPWKKRLEQEAQAKLVGPRSSKITEIDLSDLSRGTDKEMAEADEIRIRSGVKTINEAREYIGMNHGPSDLDEHLVLTTMQPIEKALAPTPPPAPPGDHPSPNTPKPGGGSEPDGGADEGGQIGDAPADVPGAKLRDALVMLFGRELDRYAKKLANRRNDVMRTSPGRADQALEKAKATFRAMLVEDCEAVSATLLPVLGDGTRIQPEMILRMAEAVEQGEPPKLAAGRLLMSTSEAANA